MARGRAPQYDEQRALILNQAARLFAQQGFMATSMNQVADACGLSKAALYHYFRDKYALAALIAETHVRQLLDVVMQVQAECTDPQRLLGVLIERFVREYASAQDAHRVLTEDVRFLGDEDRQRILDVERDVVSRFAQAVRVLRPQAGERELDKPLAMLLFGMINWLFTWFHPGRGLSYEQLAPMVADLFLHGMLDMRLPAQAPCASASPLEPTP
ncbi:TetR/AcrR family transcriptional regulator [Metallibacterium scheffleri]|jgi:AcrR family transcriptional regulator|uniref:TetR/AcrR family transcriptional regulator n=1 Tax=Metallibacterium scheffleri TaxID=993689 RepID=UPI0026F22792|nr:TetR/AcrR family transcriptional regulator [Metallibacterium scheffleri]MBW8074502.1 TetR family transcriptional regulator [Metallibacterium scheffleri]